MKIQIPHCVEQEQELLGAVLCNNSLFHKVSDLSAHAFYEPLHQRIWESVVHRITAGDMVTPITIRHEFDGDDALVDIGGGAYLAKLASIGGLALAVPELKRSIVEVYNRRRLVLKCREAIEGLTEGTQTPAIELAGILGKVCDDVVSASEQHNRKNDAQICDEIVDELMATPAPVSTGLTRLDKAMDGGLHPGFSYGFAARPKVGKTVIASTISFNLAQRGIKHLFICGEMSAKEVHKRNLSRELDVYPSAFRGNTNREELAKRILQARDASKRCIIWQNAPGLTFDELRRYVSSAVYGDKVKGIILDYWQLVGGKQRNQSTAEHLDEVAQWIANFCRREGIWSIVTGQINQDGNTRGGEGMRLAFDQVYQIHREDITAPFAWLEMMNTRYTAWMDVGGKDAPSLIMMEKGPYFSERMYG